MTIQNLLQLPHILSSVDSICFIIQILHSCLSNVNLFVSFYMVYTIHF